MDIYQGSGVDGDRLTKVCCPYPKCADGYCRHSARYTKEQVFCGSCAQAD